MTRLSATLIALTTCAVVGAAEPAAATENRLYDLLGNATWSERRISITGGLVDLDVDGYDSDQRAGYLGAAAQAISGYRFNEKNPAGAVLGLGASAHAWLANDDVDLWAVAPYAVGIAGVYVDVNDRVRGQIALDAGPGFAYVSADSDTDFELGWTWGLEGTVTISKGENRGMGIGLGYSEVHLDEFTQSGLYVALSIGF